MPGIRPYTAADLTRLRSVQARPQGWTHATHDQRREYRDPESGHFVQVITDQLGNRIRRRWAGQDVKILNIPVVTIRMSRSTGQVVA
jgi:hypothetical protein